MKGFETLYKNYLQHSSSYLNWDNITLIKDDFYTNINSLSNLTPKEINNIKNKICVIKLNGGLGTTMGLSGPKSLMKIKDDYTFMDIIIQQNSLNNGVQLLLMNSFFTHDDTNKYLDSKNIKNIISFNQHKYPRVIKETKTSLDINSNNLDHFCPPGHGDLLESLYDTGVLDQLIDLGIEYAFISNIDNLGGTLNFNILNDLINNSVDFSLELTQKNITDVKGGTLIKYENKYAMFEVAQCQPEKLAEFQSIDKFKYFNTNNIWIKLSTIKELITKNPNYLKDVDLIINNKKLKDGRDCIQLEYAIGSMIKFFDKVKCYIVDRDRFLPVKTNKDLENIKSDNYKLNKNSWTLQKDI